MADFYQQHSSAYNEKTVHVDPASFLEPLARRLRPGASILDVGCGSGRDMLWFKERGFQVTGFERAAGLAELARRHSGCEVVDGDFEEWDFTKVAVDAILLVGVLVHVVHERFKIVFASIAAGLKPGGKVLLTLKQGEGAYRDEFGRVFYLWQDDPLRGILGRLGFTVLDYGVQASKVNAEDRWLGYVLEEG